jgi:hypothetical protein
MKCTKCGDWASGKICPSCSKKWTNMRTEVHAAIAIKHGKLTAETHKVYIEEVKRLEKIWHNDNYLYQTELEKMKELTTKSN